jgi:transcriptional regulator with XRE-family HTH domain
VNDKKRLLAELGSELRRIRLSKGVTLEKLAYGAGISKGNLSDIEHGKRDPRFSTLKAISEGLEISVSQLLKKQ